MRGDTVWIDGGPSGLTYATGIRPGVTLKSCLPGERRDRGKGLRYARIKYGAGSGVTGRHVFPHPGQRGVPPMAGVRKIFFDDQYRSGFLSRLAAPGEEKWMDRQKGV